MNQKKEALKMINYLTREYIAVHRLVTLLLVLLFCIWFNPIKVLWIFVGIELLEILISFFCIYKWMKK
jgi:hypothetical protein